MTAFISGKLSFIHMSINLYTCFCKQKNNINLQVVCRKLEKLLLVYKGWYTVSAHNFFTFLF